MWRYKFFMGSGRADHSCPQRVDKLKGFKPAFPFLDFQSVGMYIEPHLSANVEVASTNFPNYERNLNTGGNNFDETAAHVARNHVLHEGGHASFVEFTTLPR